MEKEILEAIKRMRVELNELEKLVTSKRWEVEYRNPNEVRGAMNAKYPFSKMRVGDAWLVPDDADRDKAGSAMRKVSVRKGYKFVFNKETNQIIRVQ